MVVLCMYRDDLCCSVFFLILKIFNPLTMSSKQPRYGIYDLHYPQKQYFRNLTVSKQ